MGEKTFPNGYALKHISFVFTPSGVSADYVEMSETIFLDNSIFEDGLHRSSSHQLNNPHIIGYNDLIIYA
jgi:hypothetical protein